MLTRHRDREPVIHPTASVASSAVIVGAVRLGPGARVLHGAVLSAEDGEIVVGEDTIVMENALIRARAGHPVSIGAAVMIGPHAHVNGSTVEDEAFIATGASLFPGSRIGAGAEVRTGKRAVDQHIRDLLALGVRDGSIAPCDIKLTTFMLAGSINGIGRWFREDGGLSAEKVAEVFVNQMTMGLAPR